MAKTHLKIIGVDARDSGQSDFEFHNQSACGYVRDNVTFNIDNVNCFYCLKIIQKQWAGDINNTVSGKDQS